MSKQPQRSDPVSRYYKPVQACEIASNVLFWIAAGLSFVVLFLEKAAYPIPYGIVQILFALSVIALFVIGLALRLYWSPRAEDKRRESLNSNSFNTPLMPEQTVGYFNNAATEPLRRIGLSSMESCLFTRAITLEMLKSRRVIVAAYVTVFLVAVFVRNTDLAVIPIAAQAVFSEQLLSRWLRLEWLSSRSDTIYKRLYLLFQANPAARIRNAGIIEALTDYETAKANAGIELSTPIFLRLNPELSEEWKKNLVALKQEQPGG